MIEDRLFKRIFAHFESQNIVENERIRPFAERTFTVGMLIDDEARTAFPRIFRIVLIGERIDCGHRQIVFFFQTIDHRDDKDGTVFLRGWGLLFFTIVIWISLDNPVSTLRSVQAI